MCFLLESSGLSCQLLRLIGSTLASLYSLQPCHFILLCGSKVTANEAGGNHATDFVAHRRQRTYLTFADSSSDRVNQAHQTPTYLSGGNIRGEYTGAAANLTQMLRAFRTEGGDGSVAWQIRGCTRPGLGPLKDSGLAHSSW